MSAQPEPPDLTPGPRLPALLDLLHTAETLWNVSRAFFAPWNLTPSQFNVLKLLYDHPEGLSQSDLSRQLITHRSNVTGIVDRLERSHLLARHPHATDRRAWRVSLTPAGQQLLAQVLPHYYRAAETVWGDIPPARANALRRDLLQIRTHAATFPHAPTTRPA